MKNRKNIYLINAHAPDSGKPAAMKEAFYQKLELAMSAVRFEDVMVMMGDFNASMGVQVDATDVVLGTHGMAHQNAAGRKLKMIAGTHDVRDLISRHPQKFYGTWHCMGSNLPHQLDNAFVENRHLSAVIKCVNATSIVNSDHESIRLHLKLEKSPSPPRTARQERAHAGIAEWLHECAQEEKMKLGEMAAKQYKNARAKKEGRSEYDMLMCAVSSVLEMAPERKRSPRGWCDLNVAAFSMGIEERNAAARKCVCEPKTMKRNASTPSRDKA